MHFVIIVEGHTEHKAVGEFFGRWLNAEDRLRARVSVKPINLQGGGADLLRRLAERARFYLAGHGRDDKILGVVGLLDLYNPSFDNLWPAADIKDKRYARGIDHVKGIFDHPQFLMAFAVHEIEAWMLSQPENLPERVQRGLSKQDHKRIAEPEKVNFADPPSKFLDRLYRARLRATYKKTVEGSRLLHALDPEKAYEKCPYLAALLNEMLRLAQQAGC